LLQTPKQSPPPPPYFGEQEIKTANPQEMTPTSVACPPVIVSVVSTLEARGRLAGSQKAVAPLSMKERRSSAGRASSGGRQAAGRWPSRYKEVS